MRERHFETFRPLCPVCRTERKEECSLEIANVIREAGGDILEGLLHCTNSECLREYPIVDGIPLIIGNIRAYVSENIFQLCARSDLSDSMESVLGDCAGPESNFNSIRQQLSSYAWDHYAQFDPDEPQSDIPPGSIHRLLGKTLDQLKSPPGGPIVDVGCSVGGTTFTLADRFDRPVLGIDLNYPMLKIASDASRTGIVRYPRRRVGLVYDRREFSIPFEKRALVDFWACDAAALPFPNNSVSLAVCLNVLDSIASPIDLLSSLGQVVNAGGSALIGCPYDWSATATAVESWIGGHSQRSALGGAGDVILRELLTPGAHAQSLETLEIVSELDDLPWHVRLHDRSLMTYKVHMLIANK